MKQKFINGFLVVALFFVAMGSFVSCKDTDEDAIADIRGELQNQNATLKQLLEAQVKTLQDQISSLESAKQACQTECNAIKDRLTAVENKLKGQNYLTKEEADKYYVQIEAYTTKISELETAISVLTGTVNTLKTTTETAISNLQAEDTRLAGLINDLNTVATQAAADASAALALAQANEVKITNIQNTINSFNDAIVAWTPKLQQLIADAAQAKSDATAALLKANTLEQLLYHHIENCYSSKHDHKQMNNNYLSLFLNPRADPFDNGYFPTRGFTAGLSYEWVFAGFPNKYNSFHICAADIKGVAYSGRIFSFIPSLNVRFLFGDNIPIAYMNVIGGSVAGRYFDQQIAFVGKNSIASTKKILSVLRTDFRFNLAKNHYLTGIVNYARDGQTFYDYVASGELGWFGAGVEYAYNAFFGPVNFDIHWSNLTNKVGFYLGIGYNF